MPPPNWRLARRGGCFAAEAGEAGELESEELLVDPDLAAVAAFGVVAEAEVEGVAAGVADGLVGVGEGVAADVAGLSHQLSVLSCQCIEGEAWELRSFLRYHSTSLRAGCQDERAGAFFLV